MRLIVALTSRTSAERRLLVEATLLLTAAHLSIRSLPFQRAITFGAVALGARPRAPLDEILWAVHAASRRLPFRTLCFEQGLAVQRMLRRRGEPALLHYGITPRGKLEAHVWVTLGGPIVQGGEEASRFQEVGRWP